MSVIVTNICDSCRQKVEPRHGESEPSVLSVMTSVPTRGSRLVGDLCPECAKKLAALLNVEVHVLYGNGERSG